MSSSVNLTKMNHADKINMNKNMSHCDRCEMTGSLTGMPTYVVLGGAKEKLHLRLSRWQGYIAYWQGEQSCAHVMCRLVWA